MDYRSAEPLDFENLENVIGACKAAYPYTVMDAPRLPAHGFGVMGEHRVFDGVVEVVVDVVVGSLEVGDDGVVQPLRRDKQYVFGLQCFSKHRFGPLQ